MRVVAERHGCTTPRDAYIFYDVECDRSDFARLYSIPVLNRSPPSMSSRWFFVNKPVSCSPVDAKDMWPELVGLCVDINGLEWA